MIGFQTIRVEQTLGVIGASEGCSRNRYYRVFKPNLSRIQSSNYDYPIYDFQVFPDCSGCFCAEHDVHRGPNKPATTR